MATLTTAEFVSALKTAYLDPLNDNVVRSHVLLDRINKSGEQVSGNFAYVALLSGRNPAVGSRSDVSGTGPTLPEAGNQTYTAATFKMCYHYGRAQISGPVMRASKNNKNAFAAATEIEMQGLSERLPEELNRMLWSYGHGRGATISGTATSGQETIPCNSSAIFSVKTGDRIHIANIAAGTTVSVTTMFAGNITRDASATTHLITAVNSAGATISIGTTSATSSAAVYFGTGATSQTSRANEMYGVPAAIDDGNVGADEPTVAAAGEFAAATLNYGGLARPSFWSAQVMTNPAGAGTNRPLNNALLQQAFLTQTAIGGGNPQTTEVYTNPGLWATWGLLHIGDRRYSDYQDTLEGGWLYLKFNGLKVFYDRDCPRDIIWFLDMSKLLFLTQSGYEFMDDDGNVFSRVSGVDAYEFTLYRDCQLGMKMGKCHLKLDDVSANANIEASV